MRSEMPLAGALAEPEVLVTEAPRYTVEPTMTLNGLAMFALRDIKTQRTVKLYRWATVARRDAQLLNAVRPPLPLG